MEPNGGIAGFSVDGGPETYFDTYAATRVDNVFLFTTPTIASGTHTLKVRVSGLKNAASSGYNVPADRIDIISGGSAVGQGIYKIINVQNGLDLDVNSASLADGGKSSVMTNIRWAGGRSKPASASPPPAVFHYGGHGGSSLISEYDFVLRVHCGGEFNSSCSARRLVIPAPHGLADSARDSDSLRANRRSGADRHLVGVRSRAPRNRRSRTPMGRASHWRCVADAE